MNREFIKTLMGTFIFIAIELIMLTVVLGLLTYLFLKIYPSITKILKDPSKKDFK